VEKAADLIKHRARTLVFEMLGAMDVNWFTLKIVY
jgi:hypothetical protein